MIRNRIALLVSVALGSVQCTTNPAAGPSEFAAPAARASAALTVPAGTIGNGPHAMVVCQSNSGTNDCFAAGAPDITDTATLNAALAPPDAWFAKASFPIAFPYVHSWDLGRAINFWSYTGTFPDNTGAFAATSGDMDLDDRSLFPGATATSGAQFHFTRLFSGFIALPAGSTTRTFAIAADDGYSFALGGTTAGLLTRSDFGNHSMVAAYRTPANIFDATFADTVQLYPFALATYQNGATSPISGVEFAWADGPGAAPTPDFNGTTKQWSRGPFSLVPGAQIYSPDLRATMTWSGTASTAGSTVTFTTLIRNIGTTPAFPAATSPPDVAPNACSSSGLCFTLALPRTQFDPASFTVNGTPVPATNVIDNGTNILVAFSFAGPQGSQLFPGDFAFLGITAKIATGIPVGRRLYAQGRVTGHATDPSVFGASSFAPPYSVAVLTNDVVPGADNAFLDDGGNRPSAFVGFTNESNPSAATRATVVSAALGGDDDDATLIVTGSTAPGAPSFTAGKPAGLTTGLQTVSIAGTSASLKVRVVLANSHTPITQATCPSTTTWGWDPLNNECACNPASTTAWVCDPVALPDCGPVGTASCYAAAVTVTDATGDFIAPFVPDATFSVVPATTTLASNASAATFHSVTLSGLVNLNGAAGSAIGAAVNASLSKAGAAGACSTTVKADQSWTCDAPVSCAAPATSPCIVDGTYAATAALTEATGAKPVAGAGNAIVDTQPIFAALATTNTQRPTFRGSINGTLNPNRVLVCNAAATACAADGTGVNRPLCGNTGDVVSVAPGTGTWSCAPGPGAGAAIPAAPYSIVAYERDVRNNLSAPTPAQPLLVNQTRASLDTFPANLVFNLATSTLVGGGTCAPAEQIKATFSAPLASATCTTTCAGTGTNGSWSCAVPIPVVDRTPGIQIAVSQTAADSTATIPVTKGGFIVDTVAPAAPAISAPANAGATRERSPLLQISTSETAGSVDVSVLDASGQTAARCALATVPATPAFTCTPTPPLADGVFTLRAAQTDLALNPSAPGTSILRVKTRTPPPLFVATLAGSTIDNPVRIEGTAEAGAAVVVTIDGAPIAPVTSDPSGHFSATVAGKLPTGTHAAQATATDFLGNTASSGPTQFDVGLGGRIAGSSFGCSSAGGSGTFLFLLGLVPLLARRRKAVALAAVVAASAGAARADGTDLGLDNFRPATGGDGTMGVEGARPPEEGEDAWEARGLVVGQTKSLVFVPDGSAEQQTLIRDRVGGWLTGQAHVWGPLSAGLQLPFLVQQSGDISGLPSNVSGGATLGGGLGDLRTTVRAAIFRQERTGFDLAFQGSLDLPTAKKQSFLGDSALQGEALTAAGYRWALSDRSAIDLLGNLYFRFRPERDVLGVKTGDEIGLRAGVAWLPGGGPFAPQRVIFEIEGASFLRSGFGEGTVPGEWRGGVSYCAGPMTFDLALGGALSSGIGTPGMRIIGGVGFSPSVCSSNRSAAHARPPTPIHLVESQSPPGMAPVPAAPPSAAKPAEKPAAVVAAAPTKNNNDVTVLPLPELPPLPPAKAASKQAKKRLAKADPMPAMPDLPSALPLPAAAPSGATLSADRVELLRPVSFHGSHLPAKEAMLDDAAHVLSAHPDIELVAVSAPDSARAKEVIAYLHKRGVATSRLRAEGRSDAVELRIVRRR